MLGEIDEMIRLLKLWKLGRKMRHEEYGWQRADAARALAELRDPRSVPLFIGALKDEHKRVRECAASALGQLGQVERWSIFIVSLPVRSIPWVSVLL